MSTITNYSVEGCYGTIDGVEFDDLVFSSDPNNPNHVWVFACYNHLLPELRKYHKAEDALETGYSNRDNGICSVRGCGREFVDYNDYEITEWRK